MTARRRIRASSIPRSRSCGAPTSCWARTYAQKGLPGDKPLVGAGFKVKKCREVFGVSSAGNYLAKTRAGWTSPSAGDSRVSRNRPDSTRCSPTRTFRWAVRPVTSSSARRSNRSAINRSSTGSPHPTRSSDTSARSPPERSTSPRRRWSRPGNESRLDRPVHASRRPTTRRRASRVVSIGAERRRLLIPGSSTTQIAGVSWKVPEIPSGVDLSFYCSSALATMLTSDGGVTRSITTRSHPTHRAASRRANAI